MGDINTIILNTGSAASGNKLRQKMQYNFDEYADRMIQRYKLKRKSPNEFGEQPCPHCGGTDRFWISNFNGELKHHCRQNCDPLERVKAMKTDGACRNCIITWNLFITTKKGFLFSPRIANFRKQL